MPIHHAITHFEILSNLLCQNVSPKGSKNQIKRFRKWNKYWYKSAD